MAAATATPPEKLPTGVGRVPEWWMEDTPHYVFDLEEDTARRMMDTQMNFYYTELAAGQDAGVIGPDGKPLMGPDGKPLVWKGTGWGGRSEKSGDEDGDGAGGPAGGRNFSLGDLKIDPSLFGIDETDPDYHAYLTGAKLPPGYLEKMQEYIETGGIPNNLAQTDYGRYGRQAEKPGFKPQWAKKKLRETSAGHNIRKGAYDDSPNKHNRRRDQQEAEGSEPMHEEEPEQEEVRKVIKVSRVKKAVAHSSQTESDSAPAPSKLEPEPTETERMTYTQNDYYYNTKTEPVQVQEELEPEPGHRAEAGAPGSPGYHTAEDEMVEEEFDIDGDEELYDEEVIEDSNGEEAELDDLQAILAAKMAELARLQAQLED
jgi:hypothetical protein